MAALFFFRFYSHRIQIWVVKAASHLARWILWPHMQYAIEISSRCVCVCVCVVLDSAHQLSVHYRRTMNFCIVALSQPIISRQVCLAFLFLSSRTRAGGTWPLLLQSWHLKSYGGQRRLLMHSVTGKEYVSMHLCCLFVISIDFCIIHSCLYYCICFIVA